MIENIVLPMNRIIPSLGHLISPHTPVKTELSKTIFPLLDIDECVNRLDTCSCDVPDGCVSYCTNVEGTYACSCSPGFRLTGDNTCEGTVQADACIFL